MSTIAERKEQARARQAEQALSELRKLVEEGVRVELAFDKPTLSFTARLRELPARFWTGRIVRDHLETESFVEIGGAIHAAVELYRRTWSQNR